MNDRQERSYNFTLHGNNLIMETVNDSTFQDLDAEMIFRTLRDCLFAVPFCEYLKRYIYLKSGMTGSYRKIPPEAYRATLMDAFRETGTPLSMKRSKGRLSARVREWLQQTTVRRNQILLLGFGLSMTVEDVNQFLTRAIHDHILDETDPLECICSYCYVHHYGFAKMEQLWKVYQDFLADGADFSRVEALQPTGRTASAQVIQEDTALLRRLTEEEGADSLKVRTRKCFDRLYGQMCECIQHTRGTAEPVQPHDIEEILCASIPRNQHGNLIPAIHSSLRDELAGKRMSRQHIYDIHHGIAEPTRFDLITLLFFLFSQSTEQEEDGKARFQRFVKETNRELTDCGYGELYTASPYECLILMCVISEDPLGTFADILEKAYTTPEEVQKGAAECQTTP